MSKHTPGPWEACSNLVRTTRNPDGSGGFLVAECPANIGSRIEDAQLIAAAPDMLLALKTLIAIDFGLTGPSVEFELACLAARVSVNKATGRAA